MAIYFVNALTMFVLGGFIWMRWRATRSLLDPGLIFAINLIILYPVRAIILYQFGDEALPDFVGADDPEAIEDASYLALLGCLSFSFGYLLFIGRRQLALLRAGAVPHGREIETVAILFAFSLAGIGYKLATGDYMSYLMAEERNMGLVQISNVLTQLQWPAYIGVIVLWIKGERSPLFLGLAAAVMAVTIPYQFLQGSKTFLSLLLVSALIASYWVTGKVPKLRFLVACYLIVTFVFPYVREFREVVNTEFGRIPGLSEVNMGTFREIRERAEVDEKKAGSILNVSARFSGIDQLHGVVQVVPDMVDYRYARDYFAVVVNFIPRIIWPDKPVYSRGADFGQAQNAMTSVTPFPVGEAYWDFGVWGMPFMMIVWGVGLAGLLALYNRYYTKSRFRFLIALYFLSQVYWITGSEMSMPMVIASIPQHVAILFAVGVAIHFIRHAADNRR